jgi:hypothetical protein
LDTLRDKPDISPWSLSGKLDWTTLTEEAGDDQPSLRVAPGKPVGGGRGGQDPDRGRGEDQAGLDRSVVVDLLQVHRDGEEASLQDEPLDGLSAQPQIGELVAEQP